ncbi:MAG: ABC-F family ATP-binding cassette domain-containing protein [Candidatus Omnitrophica bacterium]|nr:ABC-F family ATP-binding cassette domain-containing protein [Candidatus Omnitrophota bacterium]MDD5236796.1 ABC-F family ATP-binding cassette domain-containing protein [Candidatus Omnitrophota bacterium]MDD5610305.1 ABC-F family ATP-binding cassette domain-containing protein [Candidatus Omnitrophota bacterium]
MITINNLSKSFGERVLFKDISLSISRGEKIGLIGPNGAGKSILFSIIRGDTEPTSGEVHINKNLRIGYLPQEASFRSQNTVLGELTTGDEKVVRLVKEKETLEASNAADSKRYGELLHELETLDYFQLEHKAKKILMGLGFKEKDFNRPIVQLSGGWQMRALLGKLLTFRYDILLLDEPTNYLDLNAALWLKDYLAHFKGTFIMISHDKAFLNEVTNYSFILENAAIFKVEGNYEHFEKIKEERRTFLIRQFKEQEKKRKQLQDFIARFHAQPNKAQSVRAKRTALEKMEEIVVPPDTAESIRDFRFPPTTRSGHSVMRLEEISKSYGEIQVYKDFDFEINQGEKAVLIGENGAGKSTLLKILAGVVEIDAGKRTVGHNVEIGYFSQTRLDVLNAENTVLEEAYSAAPGYMAQEAIRTILGAFLFTGEDSDKKVKVLSGGEKSRLILAKLLINPPNFLLLDEPTTHLDVDAVDALIKALQSYAGTIVFISHDIYFVRSIANVIFEVKNGQVRKFVSNLDYYLEKKEKGEIYDQGPAAKHKIEIKSWKEIVKETQDERLEHQRQNKEKRKLHNADIKKKIGALEKEKEELNLERAAKERAIVNPRSYRDDASLEEYMLRVDEIKKRISEIVREIEKTKKQIIT